MSCTLTAWKSTAWKSEKFGLFGVRVLCVWRVFHPSLCYYASLGVSFDRHHDLYTHTRAYNVEGEDSGR